MICSNCGKQIADTASFCPSCGKEIAGHNAVNSFLNASDICPGFSNKINDPLILEAVKKNKKATGIFGIIFVLIPIPVFLFLSIKNDDSKMLLYGVILSGIFLAVTVFSLLGKKMEKQWDGVVVEQKTEIKHESNSDNDGGLSTYTLYVTKLRPDRGGSKKIEEREYDTYYYEYLKVGDRVRYHPQFHFYYEKYDKSHDRFVLCPICRSKNDILRDVCGKCGVPVIK